MKLLTTMRKALPSKKRLIKERRKSSNEKVKYSLKEISLANYSRSEKTLWEKQFSKQTKASNIVLSGIRMNVFTFGDADIRYLL